MGRLLRVSVGADSEPCQRLLKAHRQRKENPWKALPLPVRNRIGNWFKPHKGEKFICYVRDTDFATETANLTRTQILVQASTTVLAQANFAPQSVLSLLG